MKNIFNLLIVIALCTSCTADGYRIKGSVEGALEGDVIYLSTVEGGTFVNLDSTTIQNGVFTFEGKQDKAVNRYIRTKNKVGNTNRRLYTDFFLENGEIQVSITAMGGETSGTPNNDAYQASRNEMYELQQKLASLPKEEQMKEFDKVFTGVMKRAATKYIKMPVGIHFLKEAYHFMETNELAELLNQIPDDLSVDPAVTRIKDLVERKKNCAIGKPFIDFEMNDPEGKSVKLSDYAGKGKIVLVDFWASWCGPCCKAIPDLIQLYDLYKGKGLEIVGISLDQDTKAWKGAIERLNIPWPQMSDLKAWKSEGPKMYAISTIPYTVLLDAEGKIVANNLTLEELRTYLEENL